MRAGRTYSMRLLTYAIIPAAMLALVNLIVARIVVYDDETQTERFKRYRRNSIASFLAVAVPSVVLIIVRGARDFHDMAWALVPLLTLVPMLWVSLKARKDVLGVGNGQKFVASSVVSGKGPLVLPESALAKECGVLNHVICVDIADQQQLECLRRVFSREPSSKEDKALARNIVAGLVNTRNCVPGCDLKRPVDVSFLMDNWSFTRTHVDFLSGEDTDETVFARLMTPSRLLIMYYPLSILDMAKNERIMTRDRYWYMMDLVPKSGEKLDHVYRNKQNIDLEDLVLIKLLRIRNPIPRAWGVHKNGVVMEKPLSRKVRSRVSEQIMSL
eukprot:jgi/Mesvir1/19802/Mv13094-RA.1